MNDLDAIITPAKGKHSPQLGPVAVVAGSETDLFQLCKSLDFDSGTYQKLFTSRLYRDHDDASAGKIF